MNINWNFQEKAAAEEAMRRQQQQAALKKLQQDQMANIKVWLCVLRGYLSIFILGPTT